MSEVGADDRRPVEFLLDQMRIATLGISSTNVVVVDSFPCN